jgi:hypothetical protein
MNRSTHFAQDPGNVTHEYPGALRIAGSIWLAVGILLMAGLLFSVFSLGIYIPNTSDLIFALFPLLISFLIAGIFVHAGRSSIIGTARDTVGNSVGSCLLAVIIGYQALKPFTQIHFADISDYQLFMSLYYLALCSLLLIAGIIGFSVREKYKAWRDSTGVDDAYNAAIETSFCDSQFIRMSTVGFWFIILCLPPVAAVLASIGLIACKHPASKRKARTMLIGSTLWTVLVILGILLLSTV